MNVVDKIIRGDPHRKTRFHDEKGNRVQAPAMLHAAISFVEVALRHTAGFRPVLPWIPRSAVQAIGHLLHPEARVLEFGSGMSTVWLAARCASLRSIESDPLWYGKVGAMLESRDLRNVQLELRGLDTYAELADCGAESFDLVLIDGDVRDRCAEAALRLVRKRGHVYLDNSDKDTGVNGGDKRRAEEVLLAAASARGGAMRYFVDFPPSGLTASQGMLVRF